MTAQEAREYPDTLEYIYASIKKAIVEGNLCIAVGYLSDSTRSILGDDGYIITDFFDGVNISWE